MPYSDGALRCIQQGLGGSSQWANADRRSVVTGGSNSPYKLSGVFSSLPSNQSFREDLAGCHSINTHRQHHGSKLYKSERRHNLQATLPAGFVNLDLVQRTEDLPPGRTCTRAALSSRRGIQDCERPMQLDVQPVNISSNTDTSDSPASSLLQLEAGPRSRGHGCIYAACRGYANPPWCLIPRCLTKVKLRTSSTFGVNNTFMENSAMVSHSSGTTRGLSTKDSTARGPGLNADGLGVSDAAGSTPVNRMAHLRKSYTSRGFSHQASDLMLASWRSKTNINYGSSFAKWAFWCQQRGRDPLSGPIEDIVNFLASLFSEGYQYQSMNTYRSAISSTHERVDGVNVGCHPAVTRLLKGVFNSRPPQPRYASFWDVGLVVQYLRKIGPNGELTLKQLTLKTTMLLALTRPSHSADLSRLDIRSRTYRSDGVVFRPVHLSKQSRPSHPMADFFFPSFPEDPLVCPMVTLRAYEERTQPFRTSSSGDFKSTVFLSWIGQHDPVSSSTIARWLKTLMEAAGIDICIFKAHSVRGAASSAAAGAGVISKDILDAADWSSEGTFQFRQLGMSDRSTFGSSVLSSHQASNNTC